MPKSIRKYLKVKQLRWKLNRIKKEFDFANRNLSKFTRLTSREREVMVLLSRGQDNRKIAARLSISQRTVEQYGKNINRKPELKSLPQMTLYVYANMV